VHKWSGTSAQMKVFYTTASTSINFKFLHTLFIFGFIPFIGITTNGTFFTGAGSNSSTHEINGCRIIYIN
jgi:hypothetical protein